MDFPTSLWLASLHVPVAIRHFLALAAPAVMVIVFDRWLRRLG